MLRYFQQQNGDVAIVSGELVIGFLTHADDGRDVVRTTMTTLDKTTTLWESQLLPLLPPLPVASGTWTSEVVQARFEEAQRLLWLSMMRLVDIESPLPPGDLSQDLMEIVALMERIHQQFTGMVIALVPEQWGASEESPALLAQER